MKPTLRGFGAMNPMSSEADIAGARALLPTADGSLTAKRLLHRKPSELVI